uniref:C2H2-type domain-containing protein n=1 Tax=Bactrocera latifrons TaxID=174628 RepID=A0A0K8U9W9_BACLA
MDISRQAFSEANTTGVSMYLSFDSSISSAAYKTLEATTCDLSMLSNMDHEEATVENSQEIHQNSTLEALDSHLNYLESVKDMDACSKLSALPKRILKEYNVVSSTPTKEQLLRSVEVVRGSSAERCVDLKFAFMDMDDKKVKNPTDKENALPPKEVTAISNKNDEASLRTIVEETSVVDEINTSKHKEEPNIQETTQKATNKISITDELSRDPEKLESKLSDINKRKSMIKKPLCEPDLKANRPSRISMNPNNRYTQNNIGTKSNIDKDINEIPKLMNKVLKFAEATITENDNTKTASLSDTRKSISYKPKGRSSMLPSSVASQGEKRPFAFTQRMSVLVKTTLNSPARKIARRSVLPNMQQNRKSIIPTGLSHNNRKNMLPVGRPVQTEVNTKCAPKPVIESTKQGPTNRKSMYPIVSAKGANVPPLTASNTKTRPTLSAKPESSFVCKVCGCKFSLKSLLDAHKRSHEGDGVPAFVKKTSTCVASAISSITNSNNGNKCRYCDKKFVLLRALHIHLLQNCPKIPPNDKRKLKFHEMDHVEKAQLPAVFHINTSGAKINSQIQATSTNVPPQRSHSDLSSISVSSTDSTNDKKALAEITIIANTAAAAVDGLLPEMAPPAARMVKKTTAHAGIHRTPNKAIICHICKISFKCIMDHIQHNMAVHFKNTETPKSNDEIDARKITTNANASATKQMQ